ncbi:hypothetical protein MIDIC_70007 [Alphaproteobacteria bacterium]
MDIFIFSNHPKFVNMWGIVTPDRIINAILQGIANGVIAEDIVHKSYLRIQNLYKKLNSMLTNGIRKYIS